MDLLKITMGFAIVIIIISIIYLKKIPKGSSSTSNKSSNKSSEKSPSGSSSTSNKSSNKSSKKSSEKSPSGSSSLLKFLNKMDDFNEDVHVGFKGYRDGGKNNIMAGLLWLNKGSKVELLGVLKCWIGDENKFNEDNGAIFTIHSHIESAEEAMTESTINSTLNTLEIKPKVSIYGQTFPERDSIRLKIIHGSREKLNIEFESKFRRNFLYSIQYTRMSGWGDLKKITY